MNDKRLAEYLKDRNAVLISTIGMEKTSWKKLLKDYGMKIQNIHNFDEGFEALQFIKKSDAEIVICAENLADGFGVDFLISLRKEFPDYASKFIALIANSNTMTLASICAENDVDSFIIKPYTIGEFEEKLKVSLYGKASLTEYQKKLGKIKAFITQKNWDEAMKLIEVAKKEEAKPTTALFYEGQIFYLLNEQEKANHFYDLALQADPLHHKTLTSMFTLLMEKKAL